MNLVKLYTLCMKGNRHMMTKKNTPSNIVLWLNFTRNRIKRAKCVSFMSWHFVKKIEFQKFNFSDTNWKHLHWNLKCTYLGLSLAKGRRTFFYQFCTRQKRLMWDSTTTVLSRHLRLFSGRLVLLIRECKWNKNDRKSFFSPWRSFDLSSSGYLYKLTYS